MARKSIFELDLVRIARWHRRCSLLLVAMILVWVGMILMMVNSVALPAVVEFGISVFFFVSVVVSVWFVVMQQISMGGNVVSVILYGLLAVVMSVFALVVVASTGGTILRLAGVKTGFAGVSRDEMDKLRPGHCRGCGYSREGLELLQECPECERVPQVI